MRWLSRSILLLGFSIGIAVAAMALELQRENFVRKDWSDRPDQEHCAEHYDGGAPVCNMVARVYWKSDDNDRLAAVRGAYQVTCL